MSMETHSWAKNNCFLWNYGEGCCVWWKQKIGANSLSFKIFKRTRLLRAEACCFLLFFAFLVCAALCLIDKSEEQRRKEDCAAMFHWVLGAVPTGDLRARVLARNLAAYAPRYLFRECCQVCLCRVLWWILFFLSCVFLPTVVLQKHNICCSCHTGRCYPMPLISMPYWEALSNAINLNAILGGAIQCHYCVRAREI